MNHFHTRTEQHLQQKFYKITHSIKSFKVQALAGEHVTDYSLGKGTVEYALSPHRTEPARNTVLPAGGKIEK